jgi:hypothetical protein
MNVIGEQRRIPHDREKLKSDDEENREDRVNSVLWQNQLVQVIALTYRILVVRAQLVNADHLKTNLYFLQKAYRIDSEEDAEGDGYERD